MKKIAIISLRFSPAHTSHLFAYAKLIREIGLDPVFILDEPYFRFTDFSVVAPAVPARTYLASPSSTELSAAIFYNAAMRNTLAAHSMRQRGIEVLYVFHEPVPIKYRLAEGWKEILKLIVAKGASLSMLRESTTVLVASNYARALYDRYYSRHNRNVETFPLLFEDEVGPDAVTSGDERRYFSFLGYAVKAHDFDGFVAFAKYAIREGSTIQFQIATRNDLSAYLAGDGELSEYTRTGQIRIQHGRMLSNDEMNSFYAQSFCAWSAYTCSTQSGALVRAFMTGTPVLANSEGSFPEFVQTGMNGESIRETRDYRSLLRAAETIRANFHEYSAGARRSFLNTFHYPANRQRFAQILAQARKEETQCALP